MLFLQCQSMKDRQKYCLLELQTLKALKKTISVIHTQRRDWLQIPYEQQIHFISEGRMKIKTWADRLRTISKQLNKIIKKSKTKD